MDNGQFLKMIFVLIGTLYEFEHIAKRAISQVQQQVNKEYQQMKSIQKELNEMSMDLHNAPLRRVAMNAESEYKDPAAWFRPDPDVWAPPASRDPDVFAPPIDRYLSF